MLEMSKTEDYSAVTKAQRKNGKRVRSLVKKVLSAQGIKVHSVTHRIKKEKSARDKIAGSPDRYGSFADLHDILGVRVITHLVTEVDAVVDALREAFDVDPARSFDKMTDLRDDEFGYRSYHLVVKLRNDRAGLPEWSSLSGVYFELQIRSILQHAWAEIEHDLGYKPTQTVPREIRRRFARLAGLLELADDEFDKLAVDAKVHADRAAEAVEGGEDFGIDRDSIRALVTTPGPVRRADEQIAAETGHLLEEQPPLQYVSLRADELLEVGFDSIEQVVLEMTRLGNTVAAFAAAWINRLPRGPEREARFSPGISLFYLYLHRKLLKEGTDFNSAPSGEADDDDDDIRSYFERRAARAEEFRRLHDEFFGAGAAE